MLLCVYVYACACVCVWEAVADIMFTTHLRNVCGGHSLKAPLTALVCVCMKVSFKFTDEANQLNLHHRGVCMCVCARLWRDRVMRETTGLCNGDGEGGGEIPPKVGEWRRDSVRWQQKEAEEQR